MFLKWELKFLKMIYCIFIYLDEMEIAFRFLENEICYIPTPKSDLRYNYYIVEESWLY